MYLASPYGPTTAWIMGIDPGSDTLGVGLLEVDARYGGIVSSHAETVEGSRLPGSRWMREDYTDLQQRIYSLELYLTSTMQQYQPIAIACESPFINKRFPQAGLVLTQVTSMIRRVAMQYSPWVPMYFIDPPTVKNAVGAKGNAGKEEVQAAMMLIPELANTAHPPIMSLDEHSVDGTAVAFAYYNHCRGKM